MIVQHVKLPHPFQKNLASFMHSGTWEKNSAIILLLTPRPLLLLVNVSSVLKLPYSLLSLSLSDHHRFFSKVSTILPSHFLGFYGWVNFKLRVYVKMWFMFPYCIALEHKSVAKWLGDHRKSLSLCAPW